LTQPLQAKDEVIKCVADPKLRLQLWAQVGLIADPF
jgi:hypothetical protein